MDNIDLMLIHHEAERIAEDSGLLLRWSRNQNKPALDESVQSFVKRCNNATEVIEDAQSTFNVHLLTEELDIYYFDKLCNVWYDVIIKTINTFLHYFSVFT